MTRVVALVAWSNGAITMEEKGVYEIDDALATDLIAQGLCADAATYFGGGGSALPEITAADNGKVLTADSGVWVAANPSSGGGVLVVTETDDTLDKTWQEIHDAMLSSGAVIEIPDDGVYSLQSVYIDSGYLISSSAGEWKSNTASGYPTRLI